MRLVIGVVIALSLIAGACVSNGSGEAQDVSPSSSTAPQESSTSAAIDTTTSTRPPPPNSGDYKMEIDPPVLQPGAEFTLSFDNDNSRGGYFYLRQWTRTKWTKPIYLLESESVRWTATAVLVADGVVIRGYGRGGPGPDNLILPEQIQPGHWRICTAGAADIFCTKFVIE